MSTAGNGGYAELSPSTVQRVDQACNRFEDAWIKQQRPRIEDYVAGCPEVERNVLLRDLIVLDVEYRLQAGDSPRPEDYLGRFPTLVPQQLNTAFRTITAKPPDSSRPKSRPMRVALVPGSAPHLSQETQTLLHRRLRAAALIGVIIFTANLLKDYASGILDSGDLRFYGPILATTGLSSLLLWSKRVWTLGQLRVVEIVIVCVSAMAFSQLQFDWLEFHGVYQSKAECLDGSVVLMAADAIMLRWFGLLVGYGVFVPNTWRRCATVVTAIACTPLLISWYVGYCDGNLDQLGPMFVEMGLWLAVGSAFAVYGSHRISELRVKAHEARKLGQYRLKKRLDSGGMGEVYLAEHVLLRRPCAVKLIRPERLGDSTSMRRFEREVKATAMLTHPNTVEIYDYGHAEDGTFYYAMEYLPGLTLDKLVRNHGPVPAERAVHFLRQTCAALQEAHNLGLIHRDIKPGNLIVCERGGVHDVVKLLDFGLVRATGPSASGEDLTEEGMIAGTPAYMAPEQCLGAANIDVRSDIYSVGALAYFLVTGQAPFGELRGLQVLKAHVQDPVVPPGKHRKGIPSDLEAVVLRCLEKDPAQRFASAADLDQALVACTCAGKWQATEAATWWRDRETGTATSSVATETAQTGIGP
jgi:serine/threonine-protein kinase